MSMQERLEAQKAQYLEEQKQILAEESEQLNYFNNLLYKNHGITLTDENYVYSPKIGLLLCYPGLIGYLLGKEIKDKEGLVDFKSLTKQFQKSPFARGALYGDKYILFAHPNFRRGFGMHENFEPAFLEKFWQFDTSKVDAYLSIDFDRVRINVNNRSFSEFDRWFGPKFNPDISKIPDGTVRLAPPPGLDSFWLNFLFANAYALDIKWATKTETIKENGTESKIKVKSFQAEEFKQDDITVKINGDIFHPVRYIHAEYLPDKGYFRHFDGAIHFYTPQEYLARKDVDFNYNSKNAAQIKSHSEKLFKFNGIIPVEDWRDFSGLFLSQNPLLIEYFEGKLPAEVTDYLATKKTMDESEEQ